MKTLFTLFILLTFVSCASHHNDELKPHEDSDNYGTINNR